MLQRMAHQGSPRPTMKLMRLKALRTVLWTSAILQLAFYTGSHWFYHRFFFNSLGVHGPDLESTFVISQLQLIGGMDLGYAVLTVIAASDPVKYREVIKVILLVGTVGVAIFAGNIGLGRLPPAFTLHAAMLSIQVALIAALYPWKEPARGGSSQTNRVG